MCRQCFLVSVSIYFREREREWTIVFVTLKTHLHSVLLWFSLFLSLSLSLSPSPTHSQMTLNDIWSSIVLHSPIMSHTRRFNNYTWNITSAHNFQYKTNKKDKLYARATLHFPTLTLPYVKYSKVWHWIILKEKTSNFEKKKIEILRGLEEILTRRYSGKSFWEREREREREKAWCIIVCCVHYLHPAIFKQTLSFSPFFPDFKVKNWLKELTVCDCAFVFLVCIKRQSLLSLSLSLSLPSLILVTLSYYYYEIEIISLKFLFAF